MKAHKTKEPTPAPVMGLRERKKARTRREIQKQTLRLIEQQGLPSTTVEQIAEAADISPSTFFRYFRNKEEAAVADYMNEEMFDEIIAAPPELGLVDALIYGVTRTVRAMTDEDWHYQYVRGALIRSDAELQRSMMEEMLRPFRLSILIAAKRLNLGEDSMEARMYGGAILGALLGLMIPLDGNAQEQVEVSRAEMANILEMGLQMIGKMFVFPAG